MVKEQIFNQKKKSITMRRCLTQTIQHRHQAQAHQSSIKTAIVLNVTTVARCVPGVDAIGCCSHVGNVARGVLNPVQKDAISCAHHANAIAVVMDVVIFGEIVVVR